MSIKFQKAIKYFIILSLLTFGYSANLLADGVMIIEKPGNTVIPVKQNKVRMVKETVKITPDNFVKYKVDAVFSFENTTDRTIHFYMGFPFTDNIRGDADVFISYVDGKEVSVTKKSVNKVMKSRIKSKFGTGYYYQYDYMYTWPITFKPHEKKINECVYFIQWLDDRGLSGYITYITKTGALWEGTIEQADFSIEIPYEYFNSKVYTLNMSPKGYTVSSKTVGVTLIGIGEGLPYKKVEWHFQNWKPTEDIHLEFYKNGKRE